jgi:hypothetical protein
MSVLKNGENDSMPVSSRFLSQAPPFVPAYLRPETFGSVPYGSASPAGADSRCNGSNDAAFALHRKETP